VSWVKRFILFHDKRHPAEIGADEICASLTDLAVQGKVAASTQNSALNALVFLYRQVLKQPFPELEGLERAQRPRRVPTVFTTEETKAMLAQLNGATRLMAGLLYGAGLRLMACVRLRVKDIDFAYQQITVRDGKGAQDRVTMFSNLITFNDLSFMDVCPDDSPNLSSYLTTSASMRRSTAASDKPSTSCST
jgi:site-specific recombinase XerD